MPVRQEAYGEVVFRRRVSYEIVRIDTDEVLGSFRTREEAVETWRRDHPGVPIQIWRRASGPNGARVFIAQGTWDPVRQTDRF